MLLIKTLRLLSLVALIALVACKDDKNAKPATAPQQPTGTYTLTFNSQEGSPVAPLTVEQGKTAVEPKPPTRQNFIFLGWYTKADDANSKFDFAATPITAHLTLYARWLEGYTLTFDSQEGSPVAPLTVEQGKTAVEPKPPTRQNLIFLGWYTNAADANSKFDFAATPITAHLTLYARWVEGYTVTLERKSRGLAQQLVVEKGKPMAEPSAAIGFFSASDVDFGGWYADEGFQTLFDFTQPITADITLYAQAIYLISTEAQLRTALQGAEGSYRLVADIALTAGSLWEPIGNKVEPFNGNFEGQGHIISNLTINSGRVGVGLFGVVGPQGRVAAVGVQVAAGEGIAGGASVGALAGENLGYVSGYATGGKVTGINSVGGLVGYSTGTVVGYATVNVEGYFDIGGLVGYTVGSVVTGYAVGNVTVNPDSHNSSAGGLIGKAYYGRANNRGYARGHITRSTGATDVYFGLLVGDFYRFTTGFSGAIGYHSGKAGESQFVGITAAERQGIDGSAIDYTATTKPTASDFSNLTFGDKPGEWTWVDGRWPSINLEAPVDQSAVTAP